MGAGFGEKAPHFDAIMKIMAPLQYSGMNSLLGDDAKILLDFNKRTWSIKTAYSFSTSGNVSLNRENSALCRGLSIYVYQKIQSMFPKEKFEIKFAKVKERNYFFKDGAFHIIILIRDKVKKIEYLLDPSFKRYGRKDDFQEYSFLEEEGPVEFLENARLLQKFFVVNSAEPLFIKDKHMLLFSVESVGEQFDNNHFVLSIAVSKPGYAFEEDVLSVKCEAGKLQVSMNDELQQTLLGKEKRDQLTVKLLDWTNELCGKAE